MTSVGIPDETLVILNQLINVAQFDIVENELVYGEMVPFMEDSDDILRQNFADTGYESSYAFVNMGTNVIILTILFFFIFLLIIGMPFKNHNSCVGRSHRSCSKTIFWNFWLRMLI